MHHLSTRVGVRGKLLKGLDLGGKRGGFSGRAVLDRDSDTSITIRFRGGTSDHIRMAHSQSLTQRLQGLGLAGDGQSDFLVEVGAFAICRGKLRSGVSYHGGCGDQRASTYQLVKEWSVDDSNDRLTFDGETDGAGDTGESMDLRMSLWSEG
jgi:hypothetical protein